MKKLLALVLCVMMFVSVLPTAAFAGGYAVDDPLYSVAGYNKQITNMIKNTKKSVENAYKALVGDKVVYTSAKAMDDTVKSMVDGITDKLIEKGWVNKAWADGVKNNIRHYLDGEVADKIAENYYKALDSDGNRDELKYAQLVADSINKALTDKKFIAGYQAVATYYALAQIVDDINDKLDDEYSDFVDSIDSTFQNNFATNYPELAWAYIDTVGIADFKYFLKDNALGAYTAAVAAAHAEYDRIEALAVEGRFLDEEEAQKEYDDATAIPALERDEAINDAKIVKGAADDQAEADKVAGMEFIQEWHDQKVAEAEATIVDPVELARTINYYDMQLERNKVRVEQEYQDALAANETEYDDAVLEAWYAYDEVTADAEAAYVEAMADAKDLYDATIAAAKTERDDAIDAAAEVYGDIEAIVVNPWGEVVEAGIGSAF